MNKDLKTDIIISIFLLGASVFELARGKTLLGGIGLAIGVIYTALVVIAVIKSKNK